MPPIHVKYSLKAKLYEREFSCEFQVTPKDELFCILYMSNVTCKKRQQVERHRATIKYVSARGAIEDQKKKVMLMQQLLLMVSKDFMAELVKLSLQLTFRYTNSVTRMLFSCSKISVRKSLQKLCAETMSRL